MHIWKQILLRTVIALLFVGALFTTVTSITNLRVTDIWQMNGTELPVYNHSHFHAPKNTASDRNKSLDPIASAAVTDEPESIKDLLDEYPQKKVLATGYTAGIESTGKTAQHPEYGITYSGIPVRRDVFSTIAADLDVFPLGTILYIPDYGYGVVADKGSAITGNHIDLYYETVEDVYAEWGKKELDVFIVKVGDGQLTEETLQNLNDDGAVEVFDNLP